MDLVNTNILNVSKLTCQHTSAVRLSGDLSQLTAKPHVVSFWANANTVRINGNLTTPSQDKPTNGWYFFKIKVSAGASTAPMINGDCLIDELRWYPQDATMETATFDDFGNKISTCDANNQITRFEYDGLNRLILVRDQEQNILEKRCYTPQGQQQNCDCVGLNLSPDWQNTATLLRCKKTSGYKNTGEQEREQRDMNPCSETYNQTRWIVVGTNLSACPLPPTCDYTTCYGEDRKCVNGLCERGIMIFTNSYNVGSRSYCDYHYEWSDGSWSPSFTLQVPYGASCLINIPADL